MFPAVIKVLQLPKPNQISVQQRSSPPVAVAMSIWDLSALDHYSHVGMMMYFGICMYVFVKIEIDFGNIYWCGD